MECIKSSEVEHKEIGMNLSASLFEYIPKQLKKNIGTFVKVFGECIMHDNEIVKIAAQK
jgi:hypothetical protein